MHDEFSVELHILPEIVCLDLGELPLIPEEVVRHQKATDGEKCIYHESSIWDPLKLHLFGEVK